MQPAFIKNNSQARVIWAVLLAGLLAVGIAYFIATNKLALAAALTVLCLGGAAAFTAAPLRIEAVLGWSIIPFVLLYPPSIGGNSALPALSTVRVLAILMLVALLFYARANTQKSITPITLVYVLVNAILLLITLVSVLEVRQLNPAAYSQWLNQAAMILLIGGLSIFLPNPRLLIRHLSLAAYPLSFILFAISLYEYFSNRSLYGFEMRSFGFDRRVPGPFSSAEVLGFMYAALVALILFARRSSKVPEWLSWLAVACCVIGATLTFFRSSWLSVIVVLLVAMVMYPPKINVLTRMLKVVASLSGIIIAAVLLVVFLLGQPKTSGGQLSDDFSIVGAMTERIFSDNAQNSAGNRTSFASVAKLMVQRQPWSGIGYGEFSRQMIRFIPADMPADQFQAVYVQSNEGLVAHNSYLQMAAECGLPAMLLLIFLHIFPAVALMFRVRSPMERHYLSLALSLSAALAVSCSSQSMFYYGAVALVWTSLLLGLLLRATDPQRTVLG